MSLYLSSAWRARRGPPFDDVQRFCFFIGHARSGHSIIGSLLNAHPEVVISHELDAVRFLGKGFSRRQIYTLILQRDEVFGSMNRTWTGYDYNVPGHLSACGSAGRSRAWRWVGFESYS